MYRIVICANTAWSLLNFRAGLITAMVANGYDVIAVAPADAYVEDLKALGCRYEAMPMDNKGTSIGHDLILLWRFWRLLKRECPAVYLGFTVKPNIYGSFAAHSVGVPVINNVAGLGTVFVRNTWLTRLVKVLYRFAFDRSAKVFFQNKEDRHLFVSEGLVHPEVTDRLPGSGVNLSMFTAQNSENHGHSPSSGRFLLIARMLWDKGVGEYIEAARLVQLRYPSAEFSLLGFLDVKNPAAIARSQMEKWVSEGGVRYLGSSKDVRSHIVNADCIVLPSYYREGVPRTLLEAAAMGRPIITTDAVGCRDVVEDGVNGYLCRPRDANDLAEKIFRFIALTPDDRKTMGQHGREKAELEFDENIVIEKYLHAIRHAIDLGRPSGH